MNFEPEGPLDILPAAFFMAMENVRANRAKGKRSMSRIAVCLAFGLASIILLPMPAWCEELKAAPIAIAVADFDYTDTSGEPIAQEAEHQARLQSFAGAIRADLERDGRYRVVALVCPRSPCSAGTSPPDQIVASA